MSRFHIVARIAGLILSPRDTLTKVSFENSYLVPFLIVTIALIGFRMVLLPDVLSTYDSPEFVNEYMESHELSETEALENLSLIKKTAPVVILFESPILAILSSALVALIIHIAGRVLYGSSLKYIPVFNMTIWTSIVSAIPLLISIPLKLIDSSLDLPTNPAFFISSDLVGSFFHEILTLLDLFLIWQIYLLAIGVSILYSVSMQRSLSVIGTMFIVFTIINAMFKGLLY